VAELPPLVLGRGLGILEAVQGVHHAGGDFVNRFRASFAEKNLTWSNFSLYVMGDRGFGLFISFFGACPPRHSPGNRDELTILHFFLQKYG
jgi:hypothetical protein